MIFTNQKTPLHFSFQRFLENQLREEFGFLGTPLRFVQRLRKAERDTRAPRGETARSGKSHEDDGDE